MADLHILNGDSLLARFSMPGDEALPMRECFVDGPLLPDVGPRLEVLRADFLVEAYPHAQQDYQKDVASIWHKALMHRAERVLFWFDRDAFCQINFTFWLAWYHAHPEAAARQQLYYIKPQQEDFTALHPAEYMACLNDALPISAALLAQGAVCWRAIGSKDFAALEEAIKAIPPNHMALRSALRWYLKHYVPDNSGMPAIVAEIARMFAPHTGLADKSREDKFRIFSHREKLAGLGDAQFFRLLAGGWNVGN